MKTDKTSRIENLLIGIIIMMVMLGFLSCTPEDHYKCEIVNYEDGVEISREKWDGIQKDTLLNVTIKMWFTHHPEGAVKHQVIYETSVVCNE